MNGADSYLECRFKICPQADITQTFNQGNIVFVNNAFNLFKRAEYYIDSKLIEAYDQPGIVNQIKGLMENSLDSEKQLTNEFWYPDRGNGQFFSYVSVQFRNITNSVRYGQLLIAFGTGANPHVLQINPQDQNHLYSKFQ